MISITMKRLLTQGFLSPRYLLAAGMISAACFGHDAMAADKTPKVAVARPTLTVTVEKALTAKLPVKFAANGSIVAWQETIIGAQANGLRLSEVHVNVGDEVRRNQVLASFAPEMIDAELAQAKANLAETEAEAANATANGDRARSLRTSGALTAQMINQYLTAEQTARARVEAQRAALVLHQLRLEQTRVLAPDRGVISARSATVGAVVPAGQELFRLIRQNRLEWRAEVTTAEMTQLKKGTVASVVTSHGAVVKGRVRMVAPTVDIQTRSGLVYVDLPAHPELKAGMFAKGEFELGGSTAVLVPPQAVVVRDGFTYLFRLGADNRVERIKVRIGRRDQNKVEVLSGLPADVSVVVSGASFLNDGDLVKVVQSPVPGSVPAPGS